MTWEAIAAIIRAEAGDAADKLLARIEHELQGLRVSVPKKQRLTTPQMVADSSACRVCFDCNRP